MWEEMPGHLCCLVFRVKPAIETSSRWLAAAGRMECFVQDQFKATSRLTVNVGFRNDFIWQPIYGTGNAGNFYTGNANPLTGQYELNALPPNCSASQGAPCIPTGVYTGSSTPAPGGLPRARLRQPGLRSSGDQELICRLGWTARLGLPHRGQDGRPFQL